MDKLNNSNNEIKCNLCGSKNIKLIYKKDTFNILECNSCKFIFNEKWNMLSDKEKLISNNILNLDAMKTYSEKEKDIYSDRFRGELEEINKFKKYGRILDIGCANGHFLKLANESGWETYGCDIDKNAAEYCKQCLVLNVTCGELDENRYPEKYFDVITMFHTLEHIPNFCQTIAIAQKILKPNGLIVIAVPNVNDLRRLLFKQNWLQFKEHHLWYFSKETLIFLLQKHGLKILRIKTQGGSQIVFTLDKTFKINVHGLIIRYFKYFNPIRNILLRVLNNLGFSEDLKIYAKNIGN